MNWHYVEQGQQVGPVSEEQFAGLVRNGKINPDTLVWHEGMANWLPFGQVESDLKSGGPADAPPVMGTGAEAACAECGKLFPVDEMIHHGNVRICAGCKPVFMQKLAEGAEIRPAGELRYATVSTRFAAVLVDGLLLLVVNAAIRMAAGLSPVQIGAMPTQNGGVALQFILMGIQMGIGIAYETVMIGKYGATLGKMACKIKVVTADGGQVTYLRALARYFAKLLSSLVCLIGYIIAIFDKPQTRALHDHICNTRVIQK